MKRRRDFVIITRILREALDGSPKTRIMNMTNMGYRNFKSYLMELLEYGLLESEDGNAAKLYKTTEKGNEILKLLSKAEKLYYRKQQARLKSKPLTATPTEKKSLG